MGVSRRRRVCGCHALLALLTGLVLSVNAEVAPTPTYEQPQARPSKTWGLGEWASGLGMHLSKWSDVLAQHGIGSDRLLRSEKREWMSQDTTAEAGAHSLLDRLHESQAEWTQGPAVQGSAGRPRLSATPYIGHILALLIPFGLALLGLFWLYYGASDATSDARVLIFCVGVLSTSLSIIFCAWCLHLDVGEGSGAYGLYRWVLAVPLCMCPLAAVTYACAPKYEREGFGSVIVIGCVLTGLTVLYG